MNNKQWAKILLKSYNYLESMADAIDKNVLQKSINSYKAYTSPFYQKEVYKIADEIIELGERKIKLINAKILINEALKQLDKTESQYLILRYVDGLTNEQVISALGISIRSGFRKNSIALKNFISLIESQGYDQIKLDDAFSTESWLLKFADIKI